MKTSIYTVISLTFKLTNTKMSWAESTTFAHQPVSWGHIIARSSIMICDCQCLCIVRERVWQPFSSKTKPFVYVMKSSTYIVIQLEFQARWHKDDLRAHPYAHHPVSWGCNKVIHSKLWLSKHWLWSEKWCVNLFIAISDLLRMSGEAQQAHSHQLELHANTKCTKMIWAQTFLHSNQWAAII